MKDKIFPIIYTMLRIFENSNLNVEVQTIVSGEEFYFKAKDVAVALEYESPKHAVRDIVSEEYKVRFSDLKVLSETLPLKNAQPRAVFLKEPGLYELIFRSNKPAAKEFRKWVFKDVLPALRKTGTYTIPTKRKPHNPLVFKMENETDLHNKVVDYIRRFHPDLLIIAGLGEMQDTSSKRIGAWKKGYQKGQPDLIIANCHKHYSGFCIEFKTLQGNAVTSDAQKKLLEKYEHNGFKVMICNDYDLIITEIESYCLNIRIPCPYCCKTFLGDDTLKTHLRWFHRITKNVL